MLKAEITRTQYAVGHGGFHVGELRLLDTSAPDAGPLGDDPHLPRFNYVYDCGSEEPGAFASALKACSVGGMDRTDILFLSHLHSDHLNGIERLQVIAPITTVVLPYLDIIDRLLFILGDIDSANVTTSALDYFADPLAWWRNRGIEHVVFLQPDDGDGPDAPSPGEPDPSIVSLGGRRWVDVDAPEDKIPQGRLAFHLRAPAGAPPDDLISAQPNTRAPPTQPVFAGVGSSVRFEWHSGARGQWIDADWILLPYVHPVDAQRRRAFRAAVAALLNMPSAAAAAWTQPLLDQLRSPTKRQALLEIYYTHFGCGHNAQSMSLYSGPSGLVRVAATQTQPWWGSEGWVTDSPGPLRHAVAWLGCGDAALKQQRRRTRWLRFYRSHAAYVAVLTLPHHGSRHNFHPQILDFPLLAAVLATTTERADRVAGLNDTLYAVAGRSIRCHIVDGSGASTYRVRCSRQVN